MVDKIYNPKTKRLISSDGALAKKLYKEHIDGKITLNSENVIKMQKTKKELVYKSVKNIIQTPNKSNISPIENKIQTQKLQSNLLIMNLSDFSNIQEISTQGTSKIYNGYFNNEKYYIKEVIKSSKGRKNTYGIFDIELACNELLASKIYNTIYNIDAIDLYIVVNDKNPQYQKYMVASKSINIDSCEPISKDCQDLIDNKIPGSIEPLLVDCILANWDIGSRGNVGIITKRRRKIAFRIDVGGALLYRAMGAPRSYTNIPNEHEQFFMHSNKGYKLFKNLNEKQINIMFDIISKVSIDDFDKLHDSIIYSLEKIPIIDFKKASKILKVVEIIKKRHLYYLNNKSKIELFLKSKIQ